jgi:rhodanese-related sulfurtransferase
MNNEPRTCGANNESQMKEITVEELKEKIDNKEDFQLIDVREPHEHEFVNIEGELIPLGTVMDNADKISKDKPVIIYCRSGARSATAIMNLEKQFGFTNLYNLKGGILAYARDVDDSLPTY